jgi:hypothetical protein
LLIRVRENPTQNWRCKFSKFSKQNKHVYF